MRTLGKAVTGCVLVGTVIGIVACGSSSKSSSSSASSGSSGSSSGGKTVDIYSSLPLQGAVNVQTIPVVNGIKLALAEAGGKAGDFAGRNYTRHSPGARRYSQDCMAQSVRWRT